jgi:hypothetical protein
MHSSKKNSWGKIVLAGLGFLVFFLIVVFLYGKSIPDSSGLAGAFAVGYFALFIAVFLPAIVLFVLLLTYLGKAVSPKQAHKKVSSQALSENKVSEDISTLKKILFITLFPLLFFFLIKLLSVLASGGGYQNGTRELKPTGEYNYTLPGNPSVIKTY